MRRAAVGVSFGVILLLFVLLLLGTAQPDEIDYVVLCSAKSAPEILAAGEHNGESIFMLEQGNTASLLWADEHGTVARIDIDSPIDKAMIYNDAIFLCSGNKILSYDAKTLSITKEADLKWDIDDLLYYSCDENGTQYAVLSKDRDALQIAQEGEILTVQLSGEATAFHEFSGGVWVSAGSELTRQTGKTTASFSWASPLFAAFGESVVLDCDGVLLAAGETDLAPLLRCDVEFYNKAECYLDDGALIAVSGKNVLRYQTDGEAAEQCTLPANALAVTKAGAVFYFEGNLCYAPFAFEPLVSLSPSPSPTPNVPALRSEGEYLICEPGTTVQELRELMKPEAAEIRDTAGRLLTGGRLATGMTANGWTVVVMGDCNGSGTLTGSDLQAAISILLGDDSVPDYVLRAADYNESGVLESYDLLQLSRAIAGEG